MRNRTTPSAWIHTLNGMISIHSEAVCTTEFDSFVQRIKEFYLRLKTCAIALAWVSACWEALWSIESSLWHITKFWNFYSKVLFWVLEYFFSSKFLNDSLPFSLSLKFRLSHLQKKTVHFERFYTFVLILFRNKNEIEF